MNNRIYLLTLFLVGCMSKQTSKETNENNNSSETTLVAKSSLAIPDSLYDYRSYYYLSNISTRDFAELYLKDSIMTNDYKKLYDCLDSLSSNDVVTRNFYFKVLTHALNNSEVVFQQSMGQYLVKNIDKFQNEFLMRLSNMSEGEIIMYAQSIEVYLSKTQDKGKKWINDLKLLEGNTDSGQLKKLELFLNEIEKSQNSNME